MFMTLMLLLGFMVVRYAEGGNFNVREIEPNWQTEIDKQVNWSFILSSHSKRKSHTVNDRVLILLGQIERITRVAVTKH